MSISLAEYERLQKYLDREMTPAENRLFEEELKTNKALVEFVDLEKGLQDVLWNKQINEGFPVLGEGIIEDIDISDEEEKRILSLLRDEDKAGNNEIVDQPAKVIDMARGRSKFFWYKVAAACIILAATTWIISNRNNGKGTTPIANDDTIAVKKNNKIVTSDDSTGKQPETPLPKEEINYMVLAKQHYVKPKAPEDTAAPFYLRKVLQEFNDGNYDNLIARIDLDKIPASRGPEGEAEKNRIKELGHYYKGIAFTERNENKKAITHLQWVADSAANGRLKTSSQWYLSIIYLKEKNIDKALPALKEIAEGQNIYKESAKKILEDIQRR